jgi:hypothetical protein
MPLNDLSARDSVQVFIFFGKRFFCDQKTKKLHLSHDIAILHPRFSTPQMVFAMNARRRDNSIFQDLYEIFVDTPVWVGPIAAAIAYAIFRWVFPWMITPKDPNNEMAQTSSMIIGGAVSQNAHIIALAVLAVWGVALIDKLFRNLDSRRRKSDRY